MFKCFPYVCIFIWLVCKIFMFLLLFMVLPEALAIPYFYILVGFKTFKAKIVVLLLKIN